MPPAQLPAPLQAVVAPSSLAVPRAVVAIPVGGAAAGLGHCLSALAGQRGAAGLRLAPGAFGVLLLLEPGQGQPDGLARGLPFPLRVLEAPPAAPSWAWRQAMAAAAGWLGPDTPGTVVLTTEAAAAPAPDWLAANLAAIAAGADAVAGRVLAAAPAGPAARYAALLDALAARLDPDPDDPWPRHGLESGASLALTRDALLAAGGLPAAGAEDGVAALLGALRQRDRRIRHAPEVVVRAAPGPLPGAPPEPLAAARRRLAARAALRRLWRDGVGSVAPETPALWHWARRLRLPAGMLAGLLGARHFGAAWAAVEAASPALARRALPPGALPRQILAARLLLAGLRLAGPVRRPSPDAAR
ncbi:hypothetical protein [Siccirubricoccus sp. G192]|uniref:hypothetical protein n=1 Tax=Siccirubricoccus sp. G192 TaxID=2849651 RepID=UPI001C2C972B|nr:hypothetical protein [Siccirubricoccus sp. G192]MBV1800120.1 hypothetical protein [Siccirubricoccus sp. G192]